MSYNGTTPFAGGQGSFSPVSNSSIPGAFSLDNREAANDASLFHGEALARDTWSEQYGHWVVLLFTAGFAVFLIGMVLTGQAPGKSFTLKSLSDIFQFIGEGIGFFFCIRVTMRLRRVATHLRYELMDKERTQDIAPTVLAAARQEAQSAQRAYIAWLLLAIGIALYASGQAVWTSYDVRMNSADVPFPGLYDIGFVGSYPFFLLGTLMLTRRNKASVGRVRLLLDAFAVIGASLALSWFFLLSPLIAGLSQAPSVGAAFLSVYFPSGDLFLVAIGALLMFSPLSNREQQPVLLRLCLGLFFLAITDSLLAFYSLSNNFNTGTVQDVLWPLSMLLIGLAAVEYPRSIAREQEEAAQSRGKRLEALSLIRRGGSSQLTTTLQTISPFILTLMTCAILLTVVATRGGATLIQSELVALALVLIVVVRQALTLIENNQLTMQMRGELVIQRRELQVTRREADEASKTAQEKQVLEEGILALRDIHARVARGDLAARAATVAGPLLPIAVSLNLMLDRLSSLSQRGARYDQLARECRGLQAAVERLSQGLPAWPANEPAPQASPELRSVFHGLLHLQRFHEGQWRRLSGSVEPMCSLVRRLREALLEIKHSNMFKEGQYNFERMIFERIIREVELLEQQQRNLLHHTAQTIARYDQGSSTTAPDHGNASHVSRPRRLLQVPALMEAQTGFEQPSWPGVSALHEQHTPGYGLSPAPFVTHKTEDL